MQFAFPRSSSMTSSKTFLSAAQIAKRLRCCKRTVHRLAQQEGWPAQRQGNRFLYAPPGLAGQRRAAQEATAVDFLPAISAPERYRWRRASLRVEALLEVRRLIDSGTPKERALADVGRAFSFHVRASSLRAWSARFTSRGFVGLLEDKVGRVGRKAVRAHRRAK